MALKGLSFFFTCRVLDIMEEFEGQTVDNTMAKFKGKGQCNVIESNENDIACESMCGIIVNYLRDEKN